MTRRRPWLIWLNFGLLAIAALCAMAAIQRRMQTLDLQAQATIHAERWEQDIALSLWRMEAAAAKILNDLAIANAALWARRDQPTPELADSLPDDFEWISTLLITQNHQAVTTNRYGGLADYVQQQSVGTFDPMAMEQAELLSQTDSQHAYNVDTMNRANLRNNGLNNQIILPPTIANDAHLAALADQALLITVEPDDRLVCQRITAQPSESSQSSPQAVALPQPLFELNTATIALALRATCLDLLPNATVYPVKHPEDAPLNRQLASLPFAIEPGPMPLRSSITHSHTAWRTNLFAWGGLIVSLAFMAFLVAKLLRINGQRADFVAAVTHEMRTPLTTFQMYTEMLSQGMVPKEKQSQYHNTLHDESVRLNRLIENVLCFARLERQKPKDKQHPPSTQTLASLLTAILPHLQSLAERAQAEWVTDLSGDAMTAKLVINPTSLEQILMNLVDNACKYAVTDQTPMICLTAKCENKNLLIQVIDQGPGLTPNQVKRAFTAFQQPHTRTQAQPGIGLGLALSRRLARFAGGELTCDPNTHDSMHRGMIFCLRLPVAG